MSNTFEKLRPSKIKRDLIPFIVISIIAVSFFVYFSYQDSIGSINYSPEVPTVYIDVSDDITNFSQQGFLKFSPISNDYIHITAVYTVLSPSARSPKLASGLRFALIVPLPNFVYTANVVRNIFATQI